MTGGVRVLRMRAIMKRFWVLVVFVVIGVLAWAGEPTSALSFLVVKEDNGKPVRNAAVVLHPVDANDHQERGGLELKTDADGKANVDGIPYGKVRVQVLAGGFQTYGEDYTVDQSNLDVTIKLKRPGGQYSIYEQHPEEKK
jgi:hypothetical protein